VIGLHLRKRGCCGVLTLEMLTPAPHLALVVFRGCRALVCLEEAAPTERDWCFEEDADVGRIFLRKTARRLGRVSGLSILFRPGT
jgi:hypothetical protein